MKNNILDPLCQRCQNNYAEFKCENCPLLFNTLCSQCDTAVHSIIHEKLMHKKIRIGSRFKKLNNLNNDNNKFIIGDYSNLNYNDFSKSNLSDDYLNKKADSLRNNNNILNKDFNSLFNENIKLKSENENLRKEINKNKNRFENEINEINEKLYEYENQIDKFHRDIKIKNDMLNELNKEKINNFKLEEKKDFYEFKLKEMEREKQYLLNRIEEQKNNFENYENNNVNNLEKENEILKEKIKNLENNNKLILKNINQLESENKDLIRRLSNQINSEFLSNNNYC